MAKTRTLSLKQTPKDTYMWILAANRTSTQPSFQITKTTTHRLSSQPLPPGKQPPTMECMTLTPIIITLTTSTIVGARLSIIMDVAGARGSIMGSSIHRMDIRGTISMVVEHRVGEGVEEIVMNMGFRSTEDVSLPNSLKSWVILSSQAETKLKTSWSSTSRLLNQPLSRPNVAKHTSHTLAST